MSTMCLEEWRKCRPVYNPLEPSFRDSIHQLGTGHMVCLCPDALGRSCHHHVVAFQVVAHLQDRIDETDQSRLGGTSLDVAFANTI